MAHDERPGEEKENIIRLPDQFGVRQQENETTAEYRMRLDRTITGTQASIDNLKPNLEKAQAEMEALGKGTEKLRTQLTTWENEAIPDLSLIKDGRKNLAENEVWEARAQDDFHVYEARMNELRAKLTIFIDAFDALPDTQSID